jgi:ribonucleoside-diphosphate reductase alpha chain
MIPTTAPNINIDNIKYYVSAFDIDQKLLVKATSIRQKWIDQGQSLNIFIKPQDVSGKKLNDIYMLAWKLGLKSTYYLRSQSPEKDMPDRSVECLGCQ